MWLSDCIHSHFGPSQRKEMRKQKYPHFAVLTATVLLAVGYSTGATAADQLDPAALKTFAPLPDVVPGGSGAPTEEQVSLGRMLYFDPRISKSQTISCNSCHP